MEQKFFFQVFAITPYSCHPVSKKYPTWLGCKRVCNRISRENKDLVGYMYCVGKVTK